MMSNKLVLNNIKCSFLLSKDLSPGIKRGDIYIFPTNCVATVYKSQPKLLNLTGIRNRKMLKKVKKLIYSNFNVLYFKIDNYMMSRKRFENYCMHKILNHLKLFYNEKYFCYYDYELLQTKGCYIQPRKKSKNNCSSLLIYRTGSCTVMMSSGNFKTNWNECEKLLDDIFRPAFLK